MDKTWDYYVCLLFLVWPFRAIAYLSPIVCALLAVNQLGYAGPILQHWSVLPWLIYSASESLFLLYYLWAEYRLSQPVLDPPQLMTELASRRHAPSSVHDFFDTMMRHTDDIQSFIQEWFYDTPFQELSRRDLQVLIAYVFFSKEWDHIAPAEKNDVNAMIDRLYELTNVKEPTEDATSLQLKHCIRHTLDEFNSVARPWLIYACTIALNYLCAAFLSLAGFRRHHLRQGLGYWHRDAMTRPVGEPLVFVHGIGAGLALYLPLLWSFLTTHPNRAILLVETPYVSMQLVDDVPNKAETMEALQQMLDTHHIASAHWMGHSLGTVICSWVCQELPHAVSHATFIDPIVFYLWKRDVAYNFLYRSPSTGLQVLMWYFASTELHIVYVMRRHFWWYNMVCFPEHLPRDPKTGHVAASVFLSTHDLIINAAHVAAHLKRGMQSPVDGQIAPHDVIETVCWDGFTHGEMLFHSHALNTISSHVRRRNEAPKQVVATPSWAEFVVNRLILALDVQ
ncbi:hypothetical protein AC1031_005406 [Aphanomyces cochlioides]|nr:hypothetical protein AC1031_005406 [Aphanomyces cochlioides]